MKIFAHIKAQPISPEITPRVRRAVATALTRTAWDARADLITGMRAAFDRPKPFTLRAFRVTMATADTMTAEVYAAPLQGKYLARQIEGGGRDQKPFERAFKITGGKVAVPGAGAKIDGYGNMPRAFIRSVLADTNSHGTAGRFFAGTPRGGGAEGVWARVNNNTSIKPLMIFAEHADYKERFDASAIADRTVNKVFEGQLMRALAGSKGKGKGQA